MNSRAREQIGRLIQMFAAKAATDDLLILIAETDGLLQACKQLLAEAKDPVTAAWLQSECEAAKTRPDQFLAEIEAILTVIKPGQEHTDLYALLELEPGAGREAIKRNYRRLSRRYHPDTGGNEGDEDTFIRITQAYQRLMASAETTETELPTPRRENSHWRNSVVAGSSDLRRTQKRRNVVVVALLSLALIFVSLLAARTYNSRVMMTGLKNKGVAFVPPPQNTMSKTPPPKSPEGQAADVGCAARTNCTPAPTTTTAATDRAVPTTKPTAAATTPSSDLPDEHAASTGRIAPTDTTPSGPTIAAGTNRTAQTTTPTTAATTNQTEPTTKPTTAAATPSSDLPDEHAAPTGRTASTNTTPSTPTTAAATNQTEPTTKPTTAATPSPNLADEHTTRPDRIARTNDHPTDQPAYHLAPEKRKKILARAAIAAEHRSKTPETPPAVPDKKLASAATGKTTPAAPDKKLASATTEKMPSAVPDKKIASAAPETTPPAGQTTQPTRAAAAPSPEKPAVATTSATTRNDQQLARKRVDTFLNSYTTAYEQKNLMAFSRFFTVNATENGKPLNDVLSAYAELFHSARTLRFTVSPNKYENEQGQLLLRGRFSIAMNFEDGVSRIGQGEITFRLTDTNPVQIRSLHYTFDQ